MSIKANIENLIIDKNTINYIPCLKARPKLVQGKLPTVLYYHGWQSNKENQRFKASIIASYGYQVIVPDSIYHGERNSINHNDPGIMEKYFWDVVINSVEESKLLIDSIINHHEADPNRIGIMGHSMGGFISSGAFMYNESIKCLINLNGSCAWIKADEIFRSIYAQSEASKDDKERLMKYDLIQNKDRINLRPILILHGDADTSVPIESQRFFIKEIANLYRDYPERLKFVQYENLNHYMPVSMVEEAIMWLEKHI